MQYVFWWCISKCLPRASLVHRWDFWMVIGLGGLFSWLGVRRWGSIWRGGLAGAWPGRICWLSFHDFSFDLFLYFPHHSAICSSLYQSPLPHCPASEPTCTKINFSSFKLWISDIVLQWQESAQDRYWFSFIKYKWHYAFTFQYWNHNF